MIAQEIINSIDPSLKYIQRMGFNLVYRVSRAEDCLVLKVADREDIYAYEIDNEAEVSRRVGDLSGITQVVKQYSHNRKYSAILKQFMPGQDLLHLEGGLNDLQKQLLLETIRGLHASGVSSFDLYPRNIVISPDLKPILIDLGTCWFEGNYPTEAFDRGKEIDFRNLARL